MEGEKRQKGGGATTWPTNKGRGDEAGNPYETPAKVPGQGRGRYV